MPPTRTTSNAAEPGSPDPTADDDFVDRGIPSDVKTKTALDEVDYVPDLFSKDELREVVGFGNHPPVFETRRRRERPQSVVTPPVKPEK